ncbi:hypothetical protein [Picosynechococcus sp. PCC 8807]|uniref:hypothetical protein n=1 Tax=Picosynechococcus sp. PCC 8807 TaxID=195248 RepID=UPI0008103B90|nr:hypothetical protein [Picosynechococcus sp. PCC 8807]ANV92023.1 hypothetical protein AWQ24_14685 [Picosynechococcus sp. PCC 8807]
MIPNQRLINQRNMAQVLREMARLNIRSLNLLESLLSRVPLTPDLRIAKIQVKADLALAIRLEAMSTRAIAFYQSELDQASCTDNNSGIAL